MVPRYDLRFSSSAALAVVPLRAASAARSGAAISAEAALLAMAGAAKKQAAAPIELITSFKILLLSITTR